MSSAGSTDESRQIRLSQLVDHVIGEKKIALPNDKPLMPHSLLFAPPMDPTAKIFTKVAESCVTRSVISCAMGAVVGLGFGLFTASVDPNITGMETPTFRNTLREMRIRTFAMSRNFAFIGGIFAGTECVVDTVRGRSELMNGTIAGGLTGFFIGFRAGFTPALWSAGGFALFSTVVDYYFRY